MDTLINLALRSGLGAVGVVIVILAIFILPQAIRILREYERGVIFRLGKLQGAKGPTCPPPWTR
jgi:regulator of protease activity HflC (stomatin/prohibitin superfamily)